jgi:hypothetical protein
VRVPVELADEPRRIVGGDRHAKHVDHSTNKCTRP